MRIRVLVASAVLPAGLSSIYLERSVAAGSAIHVRAEHAAPSAAHVTGYGYLRFNLELLLRNSLPGHSVSAVVMNRSRINFNCSGICSPLSTYSPFFFEFAPSGAKSNFRIAGLWRPADDFGNYPVPILIKGHLIACGRDKFLIEYGDSAGWALGCLARTGY